MSTTKFADIEKGSADMIRSPDNTDDDVTLGEQPRQSSASDAAGTCCAGTLGCFGGLIIVALVLGILGGAVSLIVFDIMALVQYSNADITDKCDESNMWIYLLICLILSCTQSSGSKNTDDDNYGFHLIIFLPMMIWGCIEFWDVGCVDNIENTSVYYMAYIHFVMYLIASAIICLALLISSLGLMASISAFCVDLYEGRGRT